MLKSLILTAVFCSCLSVPHLQAQHHPVRDFVRDYFIDVPRQFSPEDPWIMGKVLRTEVGYYGFFYNCDNEESKRFSPYIRWNCQNVDCPHRLIQDPLGQQLAEIKQRLRWGGCADCETSGSTSGGTWNDRPQCNCTSVKPVLDRSANQMMARSADGSRTLQEKSATPNALANRPAPRELPSPRNQPASANAPGSDRMSAAHPSRHQQRQAALPSSGRTVATPGTPADATAAARENVTRLWQQARQEQGLAPASTEFAGTPFSGPGMTDRDERKASGGFLVQLLSPVNRDPGKGGSMGVPEATRIVPTYPPASTTANSAGVPNPQSATIRQAEIVKPAAPTDEKFRMFRR